MLSYFFLISSLNQFSIRSLSSYELQRKYIPLLTEQICCQKFSIMYLCLQNKYVVRSSQLCTFAYRTNMLSEVLNYVPLLTEQICCQKFSMMYLCLQNKYVVSSSQ